LADRRGETEGLPRVEVKGSPSAAGEEKEEEEADPAWEGGGGWRCRRRRSRRGHAAALASRWVPRWGFGDDADDDDGWLVCLPVFLWVCKEWMGLRRVKRSRHI